MNFVKKTREKFSLVVKKQKRLLKSKKQWSFKQIYLKK